MSVAPFPWHTLDATTKEGARALSLARRRLRELGDAGGLAEAASAILRCPVSAVLRRTSYGPAPTGDGGIAVILAPADQPGVSHGVLVRLEAALAIAVARRVTGRPPPRLVDTSGAPAPEVIGAVTAVVSAIARRAHADRALRILAAGPSGPLARDFHARTGIACTLQATAVFDDEAFDLTVSVPRGSAESTADPFDRELLASLGRAPVALPIVLASVELSRAEAGSLGRGDAVMLGMVGPLAGRDVVLAPPRSELGLGARLGEGESVVLTGDVIDAPWSAPGGPMDSSDQASQKTMVDVLGDAAVVVRVEVGACEMPAREWALVGKGDTISLGRRLGEPVVLRIGGAEVARGELVQIDGEIGVRIVEKLA